ncbi:MAG: hypothetical protein LBQ57_03105 [Spirochaetales bacterium]|nr:hypothetical protein [Spirochaetales bacterium]
MRKTLTGSIFVTALILVLSLAGCDGLISSEMETITDLPTVEAPTGLTAVAYSGVNRISWNVSPNALGYQIYRTAVYESNAPTAQQENALDYGARVGIVTHLSTTGYLYFDDIVTVDGNVLQNGRTYTYTVVAFNNGAVAGDPVWRKSSAKITVKAIVAALGTKIDTPTGIDVKQFVGFPPAGPTDYVLVTWPAVPGRTYTVSYNYGRTSAPDSSSSALTSNLSPDGTKGAIIYPLLSGYNSITVSAQLRGTNNYYYFPSDKAVIAARFDPQIFEWPNPPNFSAGRVSNSLTGTGGNVIQLTWDVDPKVSDYAVYRADFITGGTFSGDWNAVNIAAKTVDPTSGQWLALDTEVSPEKDYTYIIIGINSLGVKTLPDISLYTDNVNSVTLSAPDFSSGVIDEYTGSPKIQLGWTSAAGVSYVLSRAAITYRPTAGSLDTSDIISVGAFTPVATISATTLAGSQTVTDTGVAARKSYRYRLVATKGAVTSEPKYLDVNETPFNAFVNIGMGTPTETSRTGTYATYRFTFSPAASSSVGGSTLTHYYGNATTVKLYSRLASEKTADYVQVGGSSNAILIPATSDGSTPGGTFTTDTITLGSAYVYKIVVTAADGTELVNLGTTTRTVTVTP